MRIPRESIFRESKRCETPTGLRTTGLHQLAPPADPRGAERRNALFYIPALAHFTVHLEFRLGSKKKSAGDETGKVMKIETRNTREREREERERGAPLSQPASAREMKISGVKKSRIISEGNLARIPRRCLGWLTVAWVAAKRWRIRKTESESVVNRTIASRCCFATKGRETWKKAPFNIDF